MALPQTGTPKSVLLELARRCESERPTYALDVAIWEAVEGVPAHVVGKPFKAGNPPRITHLPIPNYTRSRDAAATLAPEGWIVSDICQTYTEGREWHVALWKCGAVETQVYGDAKTEPAARVAAALKARAALTGEAQASNADTKSPHPDREAQ
ncbi:MAG: hypothetical protein JNL61_11415 [Rhizobiaceae bacterium]|nr:hypothetical protein [Rhizobiaceae bacterium]